ncbi:hypothetical protein [Salinarchaeum laminariae]|uniref:hypothetical protein n=1 Tax=Salinarchaeum laminariae TaxID=869888 RepID=UPI0020BEBC50|nr:hypothetical protein [Salinarchaeum laminariae]
MQLTVSPTGYESSVTDRRTLGGMLTFVVLVAAILLAVSHPTVAAAAAVGAVGAHLAHHARDE